MSDFGTSLLESINDRLIDEYDELQEGFLSNVGKSLTNFKKSPILNKLKGQRGFLGKAPKRPPTQTSFNLGKASRGNAPRFREGWEQAKSLGASAMDSYENRGIAASGKSLALRNRDKLVSKVSSKLGTPKQASLFGR